MYIPAMHLSDYMAQRKLRDVEVADAIETTRATVSRIRRRKVRPGWEMIEKLRGFSGGEITADDFISLEAAE